MCFACKSDGQLLTVVLSMSVKRGESEKCLSLTGRVLRFMKKKCLN